jgi:hypothetical protein
LSANLTGAQLETAEGLRLPAGATWDSNTHWPAYLASRVVEESDEVAPGVYRVRGDQTRDRSGAVRV